MHTIITIGSEKVYTAVSQLLGQLSSYPEEEDKTKYFFEAKQDWEWEPERDFVCQRNLC